jgi:DNA-directed RNA polymerase subunit RPC12/RpoP
VSDRPLDPSGTESDAYTCPDCGKKMAPGFLALGGRANWVDHVGAFDAFRGDTIVGAMDIFPATGHLRGWRCEDCGLILLEY